MRVITWNLLKGFTREKNKYSHIMEKKPDILVLFECRQIDYESVREQWTCSYWYKDNLFDKNGDMGIAVFSNDYELSFTDYFNRNLRYVLPLKISKGGQFMFYLFSVWTQTKPYGYLKTILNTVKDPGYKEYFSDKVLMAGDFNMTTKPGKSGDYEKVLKTGMLNAVSEKEIYKPTYFHNEVFGFYTADYCLVTQKMKDAYNVSVTVGDMCAADEKKARYEGLSDHAPLIIDIS